MSERYSRLFSLEENLYSADIPVLLSAGALTKDSQTGKIFVQLRFQNIDSKFRTIIALKVAVTAFDPAGKPLDAPQEYQYLDLNAGRGTEFGSKQAIYLDNNTARSFKVAILEIVFSEGMPWTGTDAEWISLGKQKTLEEAMGTEMAEQYRRDTFAGAKYEVFANNGVWVCACGSLNTDGESTCCHCHNSKTALFTALDHTTLAKNLSDHNAEIASQAQKKAQAAKKTAKKIMLFLIPVILVGLFIGVKSIVASQQEKALRLEQERIAAEQELERRALEVLLCSDTWVKIKDGETQIMIRFDEDGTGYFSNQYDSGEAYWKAIDGNTFEFYSPAWGGSTPGRTYEMLEENGVYYFTAGGVHVFHRRCDLD